MPRKKKPAASIVRISGLDELKSVSRAVRL